MTSAHAGSRACAAALLRQLLFAGATIARRALVMLCGTRIRVTRAVRHAGEQIANAAISATDATRKLNSEW